MSVVILEHASRKVACPFDERGRVLVGRWGVCDLTVNDPRVAPIQLWIGTDDDGPFVVEINSSKSDRSMTDLTRRRLTESEVLSVGPARLRLCHDDLPPGIRLLPAGGKALMYDVILFDCPCGAPMLARRDSAGRVGHCRICDRRVIIPQADNTTAAELNPTAAPGTENAIVCGVCQWPISSDTPSMSCPECGVRFHSECWEQNGGCCSYGCSKVGCLPRPESEPQLLEPPPAEEPPIQHADGRLPWIAAGIAIVGLLWFGLPSVIMNILVLRSQRGGHPGRNSALAMAISMLGIVAGLIGSYWWWIARTGQAPAAPGGV